jgi:hypothetical protein
VPISRLAELRTSNPGRRPHSIIGPIAVNDAEPGDLVEIRYRRLHPVTWGAVFNDPADLGTGPAAAGFLARPDQIRRSRLGEDEGEVRPRHHHSADAVSRHIGCGTAGRLFPAVEPGSDELCAARPAWRQSRPARASRRLGPLPAGMEAGRLDQHWRLACSCRATARSA